MTQQELNDLHALVWQFRGMVSDFWPTPEPADALRYAFTEAGEAMDASLREKRPNDKRNNDKDHDRLDEWADCAIMLLTAVTDDVTDLLVPYLAETAKKDDDDYLCLRVAWHLYYSPSGMGLAETIGEIARYTGINLNDRINGRLRRITYKHVPAYRQAAVIKFLETWSTEHAI
jgi:hypothetical protein